MEHDRHPLVRFQARRKAAVAFILLATASVSYAEVLTLYSASAGSAATGGIVCSGEPEQCIPANGPFGYSTTSHSASTGLVTSAGPMAFGAASESAAQTYFSIGNPPSYPSGLSIQYGTGKVSGSVEFGAIHIGARAFATTSYSFFCYNDDCLNNPGGASAAAGGGAGWRDEITIVSNTLEPGTPIQVRASFALHSIVDSFGFFNSCNQGSSPSVSASGGVGVFGGDFDFFHNECNGGIDMAKEVILSMFVAKLMGRARRYPFPLQPS